MPDQLDTRSPVHVRRPLAAATIRGLLSDPVQFNRFVRLAASRLRDPSEAEDVVQSAAAAFIQGFDPRGHEGDAGPYFIRAVLSHASKANRTLSRHRERYSRPGMDGGATIEEHVGRVDDIDETVLGGQAATAIMAALPIRERMAIAMQQLGFERHEIAAALDVSDRGLRKVIGRARAKLREEMEREGGA